MFADHHGEHTVTVDIASILEGIQAAHCVCTYSQHTLSLLVGGPTLASRYTFSAPQIPTAYAVSARQLLTLGNCIR